MAKEVAQISTIEKNKIKAEVKKDFVKEQKKTEKKVGDKIEKKLQKKFDLQLKRELAKGLRKAKSSASTFKEEYKKHLFTALAAAFGFLIALSWKEPVTEGMNQFVEAIGLNKEVLGWQFLIAFIITLICVLALMILAKFGSKK